jgi:hypothetical protein
LCYELGSSKRPSVAPSKVPFLVTTKMPSMSFDCYSLSPATTSKLLINGISTNTLTTTINTDVNIIYTYDKGYDYSCPGCMVQLYIGITGQSYAQCIPTSGYITSSYTYTFTKRFASPGCYTIYFRIGMDYSCQSWVTSGQIIGSIFVQTGIILK